MFNIYVEEYGESFVRKNFTKRNIEEIREVVETIKTDFSLKGLDLQSKP